jgi:hypothetical protein
MNIEQIWMNIEEIWTNAAWRQSNLKEIRW